MAIVTHLADHRKETCLKKRQKGRERKTAWMITFEPLVPAAPEANPLLAALPCYKSINSLFAEVRWT